MAPCGSGSRAVGCRVLVKFEKARGTRRMGKTPRKLGKKRGKPLTTGRFYKLDRGFDLARLVINWVGTIGALAIIGWWISMIADKNT